MTGATEAGVAKGIAHVVVDTEPRQLPAGSYSVAELKAKWAIPPEKVLDILERGSFVSLDDAAQHEVENGQVYASHVRRGGSS